jgi:ecotin
MENIALKKQASNHRPVRIVPAGRTTAFAAITHVLFAIVAIVVIVCQSGIVRGADADPARAAIDPEAVKNLDAAFPKAPTGRERKVILLPHKERGEEDAFRVEIVVGRTIQTDGINRYSFPGRLVPRDIQGWGFTYHDVEGDLKDAVSTRMAGVGNPAQRFVPGPAATIPYNSRLPIVVMVPEGCELRWRVWRADPEFSPAEAR